MWILSHWLQSFSFKAALCLIIFIISLFVMFNIQGFFLQWIFIVLVLGIVYLTFLCYYDAIKYVFSSFISIINKTPFIYSEIHSSTIIKRQLCSFTIISLARLARKDVEIVCSFNCQQRILIKKVFLFYYFMLLHRMVWWLLKWSS